MSTCNVENGSVEMLDGELILPLQYIFDNAYLKKSDAAFIGGSLIENTGNNYSDVDVHVITETLLREKDIELGRHYRVLSSDRSILTGSKPSEDVFLIHTVVPGSHVKVDIEYRTLVDIEKLAAKVRETFDYAVQSLVLLTKYMDNREMAFIHRLFNSIDLCGDDSLNRLRHQIGKHRFEYLMYRWKASDFAVLLDLLGAWEREDWVRCADMARENMVTQFQAYTHLCGNTHYSRKWIITYAKRYTNEVSLFERYITLLMANCGLSSESQREYILSTIDFVDEIFKASHEILKLEPSFPSGSSACASIDEYFKTAIDTYSEMEKEYRKKAYGISRQPTRNWFND
ncbi:hypothetical protein ABQ333_20765 [Serratia fonticola]|uniref:hypothetical protein n=1 Tax=Serratia fonticola TaxID=47917 RepID=UPI0015C61AE6|nr:hypothetical protein [Serratia fonticola]NYA45447.1 hypothetical protein [Serratia fonticola]